MIATIKHSIEGLDEKVEEIVPKVQKEMGKRSGRIRKL